MSAARSRLLQLALPLVREHGFTRTALARSVLAQSSGTAPLDDNAVSTLFGSGDEARRTLIRAWLEEGHAQMSTPTTPTTVRDALQARLRYNEPVLAHLPEAFALLASPQSGAPPLDPRPALHHAATISDAACRAAHDASIGPSWYTRRAALAALYTAAELHQLTSARTAPAFLDALLESSADAQRVLGEARLFASYVSKSWAGLAKSSGVFF